MYGSGRPWPGTRVLVDRRLTLTCVPLIVRPDIWMPGVAPSAALWRWYDLDEANYPAFARRYARELAEDPSRADALRRLRQLARTGPLILQTAATPLHLGHARVLARQLATDTTDRPPEGAGDAACWLRAVCPPLRPGPGRTDERLPVLRDAAATAGGGVLTVVGTAAATF
ncbi:DUF488 domain-containing protein [Streptomyces sp. NPDC090442]|uniref:DUF488 domain-containing protein n=1 Tax=Streptomyces sp. NPDC090442 TaxID=3365962 RepID=UPI00381EC1FA